MSNDTATGHAVNVRVTGGEIRGKRARGLELWRGIPYAGLSDDGGRFRAPVAVVPWSGVRDCAEWGPVAPQAHRGQFAGAAPGIPMAEDCLNLNVMRAAGTPADAALPVMVFIHGGAYSVGSSREVPRAGEALARLGGVVYVSINYRLGALGYLDLRKFSTPERPIETNLGLRDQVAALAWVRDNIREFGGDPANVTLFGESAGGNAVTTLMATPSAHGLFHRVISQSSPANAVYLPEQTSVWADEYVELLSERVAAGDVESTSADAAARMLARASTDDLVAACTALQVRTPDAHPGSICLSPVIDDDVLPERPLDAFKAGRAARVPLIIGTNDREGSLFVGRLDILARTPSRIRAIFSKTDQTARHDIMRQYPGLPDKRPASDFAGDYSFWFPCVKAAERHARFAPTYFYRFDFAPRLLRAMGLDATHGLELFAVFADRMHTPLGRAMTALGGRRVLEEIGLRMQRRWLAFAATGDPNGRLPSRARLVTPIPEPLWPRYDPDAASNSRLTLVVDSADRLESDPGRAKRLAWQEFVPYI